MLYFFPSNSMIARLPVGDPCINLQKDSEQRYKLSKTDIMHGMPLICHCWPTIYN